MKGLRYWMYIHRTSIGRLASQICREITMKPIQMMWCTQYAIRFLTWVSRRHLDRTTLVNIVKQELQKIVQMLNSKGIEF